MKKLYQQILKEKEKWNYYNKELVINDIQNPKECYYFIHLYIKSAGKASPKLIIGIDYLKENDEKRLVHIVSTFFLGIALYFSQKLDIEKDINDELKKHAIYKDVEELFLKKQFAYIWFMITLFHDLGYKYEQQRTKLPKNLLDDEILSVPPLYTQTYESYYKYRDNRDHGIYEGILLYQELCRIRKWKAEKDKTNLSWNKKLIEVYRSISWIVIAHNIWFKRRGVDKQFDIEKYKEHNLDLLILSEKKEGQFDYPMTFKKYPLFFLFCLIDTIEPTKTLKSFSETKVKFVKGKMIIETNDVNYIKKIQELENWLMPITLKGESTIEINFYE